MAHCLLCDIVIGDESIRYHLSNMGMEITDAIEALVTDREIQLDSELCETCFANILHNADTDRERILTHDFHVCIWCRTSLHSRRTHSVSEGPERIIIAEHISPRMITEGALACYACWVRAGNIAQSRSIETLEISPVITNTCVLCNISLNRRRSHGIPIGAERNYILSAISPREITSQARVCWNCWRTAQRRSRRIVNSNECAYCLQSLTNRQYHQLGNGPERDELLFRIFPRQVPLSAHVCMDCWQNIQNNIQLQETNQEDFIVPVPVRSLQLNNYKKTANTSRHCFVPECGSTERHRVPNFLRKRILSSKNIYVAQNSRVCNEHLVNYNWDMLDQFEFNNYFNENEIESMMELTKHDSENIVPINFENLDDCNDNTIKYWTSLNKTQFFELLHSIPSINETCKKPKTALGVFLVKLRTGDSNERIASLFQISKSNLISLIKKAREALKNEFVPLHLGLHHISREDLIRKNLLIPEGLFGNQNERKPIVICDGSYIYIQKSSNYLFQKKTYSLHKHRNLIKPFLIVACDGYIVDVSGPYKATDSDADIMKALFQDESGIYRRYFRENDIFILDRGFRDALPLLTSLNYKVFKPESVEANETQLTTLKANKSRFVTLCRWVVEIVNGQFKRDFKLFRQEYFNLAAEHLFDDFRVCAALINSFRPRLDNRPDAPLLLERAQARLNVPNNLANYVIENNINRIRAQFVRIDGDNPELDIFPEMTHSDLMMFSLGIYQIKQAKSYYGEHIRRNGSFEVEVSNQLEVLSLPRQESSNEQHLLRARIKSRHQSSKIYNTYILLNSSGQTWDEKIIEYYCTCICGKRTVGCCSHVMTIVWYLGWARHQTSIAEPPASFLDSILFEEDE